MLYCYKEGCFTSSCSCACSTGWSPSHRPSPTATSSAHCNSSSTPQYPSLTQVFLLQRLIIILFSRKISKPNLYSKQTLLRIAPYSFIICTSNILTSYCVTVMPLAAYMAFKKFVVFFVLVVGMLMALPNAFTRVHHCCIFGIVAGGLLIGGPAIF